ncbi:D-alanine--D-alanine ligase family protein [Propionimicrobium sp. PCR01-08-3]|uniref:D-alanine--D-alanine ligase family protein n=1 Tax=Propionimicrobium sp. PCR01-08-3 TaxID=3052086 RepID=UPI00255C28D6|nr:D-alanine--D-alanine ligase family protein [Propionimicrobium sp. PCR01-08-3]WIY83636.1 D-alanine--D-alanine ligase family protein [Propionimicrobium sp. PCR01-08-3]
MPADRTRVALIFGGQSTEHQISCLTAAGVAKAIDTDRFEVYGVGISPSGIWHRMSLDEITRLRAEGRTLPSLDDHLPAASLVRESDGVRLMNCDGSDDPAEVDVALVLLHGAYGEDGTVQGMLEMLGLPYVGSGVAASAIGMDKHLMKVSLANAGLPIGPYELVRTSQWDQDRQGCCDRIAASLTLPVYVKPARGGSSVGITRVTDPADLAPAIESARGFDPKVIVEEGFVDSREVECAVLGPRPGEAEIRTSHPGEIVVHSESAFYDFDAKYLPEGQVDLKIPAELPAAVEQQVRELSARCFEALEVEGLARVDTFVTASGDVFINELNTMPGFTELSMFPSLWQVSGLSYTDLITDLIEQALARPNNVIR